MSNKTAMQELIEYLEKYKEVIGMTAVMTIDKAKSLLKQEKDQIHTAFNEGRISFSSEIGGDEFNDDEDDTPSFINAENYYNETYK